MRSKSAFTLFLMAGLLAALWASATSAQRDSPVGPSPPASFSDRPRPPVAASATEGWQVVGSFPGYAGWSLFGVDHAPPHDYAVLSYELREPGPTIYNVDYASHALLGSFLFSDLNPGWPTSLNNRNGVEYDLNTGHFFAPDYSGDATLHDDNIIEYVANGVILNAWETDDDQGSNDSYDGSAIDGIQDIAVAPGPRYFVTTAGEGATVYEIDLIKTGLWWTPNTWGTIATWTVPGMDESGSLSYDADHGVLYHSDEFSDTIVVTDLDGALLETFTCHGANGVSTGIGYVEGKAFREIWTVEDVTNWVTICKDVVVAPCEWETVWSDDFEGGYGNWLMGGLWNPENEAGGCGSLVAPFPSSPNGAYYGIDRWCTYNNGQANQGSLTMLVDADLGGALNAEVRLWSYEQTECGGECAYDDRYVDFSTDGGASWSTVDEAVSENAWYSPTFSLIGAAGGTARVRFRFDTFDGGANDYFGWMIDNVEIRGCFPIAQDPMHVGSISGHFHLDPYGRTLLQVYVVAHDANHSPLGGVAIDGTITPPQGGVYARTRVTKYANGTARFHWGSNSAGTWQSCVDSLTKEGYEYVPGDNEVPSCVTWNN